MVFQCLRSLVKKIITCTGHGVEFVSTCEPVVKTTGDKMVLKVKKTLCYREFLESPGLVPSVNP